ncbi:MAG: metal ABC transporter ATP-binding protein [Aquificae bacterium]|nr:metal ABC transporter ATP-binding protein [Aquificota bacterium]
MQLIRVEDLSFSYDGRVRVLEEVSFGVDKGDFVGVIGPNGAGKTTLFKILLGFLRPSRGKVFLFGEDIRNFRDWSRIGYVPQRLSVEQSFPATVEELLSLVAPKERVRELADFLHMNSFIGRQFQKLSGGQQQLVLLGMALASGPELLLLDEPTAGLDVHAQMHILEILKDLSLNEGKTIMMISHDIGTVLKNVDKVLCLNRKVLYYGEPDGAVEVIEEMFGLRRGAGDGTP